MRARRAAYLLDIAARAASRSPSRHRETRDALPLLPLAHRALRLNLQKVHHIPVNFCDFREILGVPFF